MRPENIEAWGRLKADLRVPLATGESLYSRFEFLRLLQCAGADIIHFDVMDNHYVPNLTIGPLVCRALRPLTDAPIDVHLMVKPVDRIVPEFADAGVAHFWSGVRTLTPDDRPIVGADPDVPGLFWVAGLGGHGMTVSAGVGRLASELLLGVRSQDDRMARDLSPTRWTEASGV